MLSGRARYKTFLTYFWEGIDNGELNPEKPHDVGGVIISSDVFGLYLFET